jgi:hypothetical protein
MTLPLVNRDTGQIDQMAITEAAALRAASEYGAAVFPPAYLRSARQWVEDRAAAEQRQWHRDRNLPVPGEEVLVTGFVPSWGSSGDSYGRGA